MEFTKGIVSKALRDYGMAEAFNVIDYTDKLNNLEVQNPNTGVDDSLIAVIEDLKLYYWSDARIALWLETALGL